MAIEVASRPSPTPLALRAAFTSWFGLERGAARVLAALYDAAVGLDRLELATLTGLKPATIGYNIHVLRQALDTEAIDFKAGEGYRLTESGRSECLACLWKIGEELRCAK